MCTLEWILENTHTCTYFDRGTVNIYIVICRDLTWAPFVARQTRLLFSVCCHCGQEWATVSTNQYIIQHRHSVMHHLCHISSATSFGTAIPSSGCHYDKGVVWANMPVNKRLLLLLLLLLSSSSSSSSLVTGLFFLVLLLYQRWSPPLRLQVSHCSTFRIMCDVPSIAVFCSESDECFPGISSKFFLKLLVTIPVASVITGIIIHFRFHIHCISISKLLYFKFDAILTVHRC